MSDIYYGKILCSECGTLTRKNTMVKEGFQLRILECPKCGHILYHPVDLEKYRDFKKIKKKQFNVKLRMVGNSYAVSIPREIIEFFENSEEDNNFHEIHKKMKEDMDRMNKIVTLAFEQANKLSLDFGENYDRTIEKNNNGTHTTIREKSDTNKLLNRKDFVSKKLKLIKSTKNKKGIKNERN